MGVYLCENQSVWGVGSKPVQNNKSDSKENPGSRLSLIYTLKSGFKTLFLLYVDSGLESVLNLR